MIALVPAAGHSTRMGQPKLALPLGSRSVLEHVIAALHCGGVEHVLVVLGPHVFQLVPLAQDAGAHVHCLSEATPDMRATIEHGLSWLETNLKPQPDDTWLLVPADHPTLSPAVIAQLVAARQAHPDHSIFVPTHAGRRGHPLLLAWRHVAGIRAYPAYLGLNRWIREQSEKTLEVAVPEVEVTADLDTPEDYARLVERWTAAASSPLHRGSRGVN
jgi:CTP:molybdopterin cytidylyltransferase MocA